MAASSYRHIFKYTSLFGGVQVFYILMAVVRNKVTALLIGAAGMGLADLYVRTLELLSNATSFGLGLSAVRQLSAHYDEGNPRAMRHYVRLVRSWILLTGLLGMAVCLLASPLVSLAATGGYGHTAAFCLLSPVVLFSTLLIGEAAILKGMRRLRQVAWASAAGALATLLITAPLYAWLHLRGIVPALVAVSAATFGFNLRAATRVYPYRVSLGRLRFLRQGLPMLRLGTAYILAGVMTAGAELAIRALLVRSPGGLESVGLYAAGFTLTVSYARIIFVAMDADFFPRLSACAGRTAEQNLTINRQTDMLMMLMTPFLILFCLCLPLVIHLLYTPRFLPVAPMVICAAGSMFCKAVYTPMAYLPLARGHSVLYMVMELVYDVLFAAFVIIGYRLYGLAGAGLGITLAHLADLLLLWAIYSRRYSYRMSAATLRRLVLYLLLLAGGLCIAARPDVATRAAGGTVVLVLVAAVSLPLLRQLRKKNAA